MKFTSLSIGKTKKCKYKIFCLVSNDGTVDGKLNQLRAISFKDQPRVGFNTYVECLTYAQSLPREELIEYIEFGKLSSRGVHVDQQEYPGKYIHKLLEWTGDKWIIPVNPQLEFDFVQEI